MIPETTRDQILAALQRFDREQRDTPEWANWEGRGTQRYALVHDGKRYPPKQIVALAAGLPRTEFGGGSEMNDYLAVRGFPVVALNSAPGPNIWWVNQGNSYRAGRDTAVLWAPLVDRRNVELAHWQRMLEVRQGDVIVHYSAGQVRGLGRATGEAYEAPQPPGSAEDDSANATETGRRVDVEFHELSRPFPLTKVADRLQSLSIVDGPIARHAGGKQGYLWRFNRAGLRVLRAASDEPWPEWAQELAGQDERRSWVFQSMPDRYDIVGALRELKEITWRVNQHRQEIHPGDTVYFWEGGPQAGVLAVATILTEPAEMKDDEHEARFNRGLEGADEARLSVRLRIERVLSSRVPKQTLLDHPILKNARILVQPNGTNFALTEEQAAAMSALTMDRRPRRIVKITPGEDARYWPDCLESGYICVGWEEVGDLRKYPSQDDFLTAFRIQFPAGGTVSANGLWSLLSLEPGDLIVANRGKDTVLGVGEVVAPGYQWRPDRPIYNHTVRVRWDTSVARRVPTQHGWMRTIVPVPPELYAEIIGMEPATTAPEPPAPQPEHRVSFDALLRALEEEGLAYSPEVVSNYLLALQTKRFVIFTGISGTGKTRLAQAVARAFQPRVRVTKASVVPSGAIDVEVKPYMTTYHRMVLPTDFAQRLVIPPANTTPAGGQLAVSYPGGQITLSYYKDPERNVTQILFKGAFRAWFDGNLPPGSHFLLEATEQSDGSSALRFSKPGTETLEELLDNTYIAAVRPDWTDNRGLLGYHNPLTGGYARTPFLDLLLRASEEEEAAAREKRPPRPFFAILDEMNLARVEHYFSDFLSALESGEPLYLHGDERIERGEDAEATPVPRQLRVPSNLFFTGTVNVDETTYMFSPKVLDRAFTIEFNRVDLRNFGAQTDGSGEGTPITALELTRFPGLLRYEGRPEMTAWDALGTFDDGRPRELIVALHDLLAEDNRHFGYRVAVEIARYVVLAAEQAGADPATILAALDLAILQKVLPKFHGTQQELETTLAALCDFAIHGQRRDPHDSLADLLQQWRVGRDGHLRATAWDGATVPPTLPRTAAKLWGMLRRLRQQGFASFIE